MKIAFCCGCLEPGRDGVGDYVRRLGAEFARHGHSAIAVALHDPYVSKIEASEQKSEATSLPVLRIPNSLPWPQRVDAAREWLRGQKPDWMSLQFVPFGYHPKGLCFGFGKSLAALNGNTPWHVMFHELWLGLGDDATLKARVWGELQRRILLDAVRRLRPRVMQTQAEPYRLALDRVNIQANILPLFSNIPIAAGDGWNSLLSALITEAAGTALGRGQLYLAGVLGGVHPEWSADRAVDTLLPLVQKSGKRLALVFHGKNHLSPEAIQKIKTSLQGRALVVVTGERSSADISLIMQTLDLGLATSPLQVIQKSGSVVAMLEHGLPILIIRDDWHLRGAKPQVATNPRLLTPEKFAALQTLPVRNPALAADNGIKNVAEQMLSSLAAATPQGA